MFVSINILSPSPPLSPSLSFCLPTLSFLSDTHFLTLSSSLTRGLSYFLWDENSHNLQCLLSAQISKPCISKEALLKFRKSFLSQQSLLSNSTKPNSKLTARPWPFYFRLVCLPHKAGVAIDSMRWWLWVGIGKPETRKNQEQKDTWDQHL